MTATRDRRDDPDTDDGPVPWDERLIAGERRGLPWWGAVLLALGFAVAGAVINFQVQDDLGLLFQGCYFVGAVGAICVVRRRSLFGPMVQPPLILGVTVPSVVLFASGAPTGSDTLSKVLAVSTPLINGFPTMAITTGITLAIGLFRMYRERDPHAPVKPGRDGKRPAAKPAGRSGTAGKDEQSKPARPAQGRPPAGKPAERRPAEGRSGEGRQAEGRGAPPAQRRQGTPPPRGGTPGRPPGQRGAPAREPGGGKAVPREPGPRQQPRQPRDRREGRPDAPGGTGRPRRPRPDDPMPGGPDAPRRRRPPRGRPWDEDS